MPGHRSSATEDGDAQQASDAHQQQQPQAQSKPLPDKIVLVIIDGVGDVTIPAFGDRTPLQVAHTPNLDCISAAGLNGLVDAVEPGLACGSDTSHMNLLGYDPRKYYRGRGAFESMGAGLDMSPGDIAFKSNFASYNRDTGLVEKRRADRQFEHLGPTLCAALDGLRLPSFPQHAVSVKYATEHRCGVVVRGPGLSDVITGTDPLKDNLPLRTAEPLDDSPEARHTAAVVNELSAEMMRVLEAHPIAEQRRAAGLSPANCVLLRGCGCRIQVPQFQELQGLRGCLVAPTKIIAGMGMSLGLDVLEAPGATGSYDSHFASKAATAVAALTGQAPGGSGACAGDCASAPAPVAAAAAAPTGQHGGGSGVYDFVLLHVKAVDDTGHDRLLSMKVKFLEVVDIMIGHILLHLHDAEQQQQQQLQQQAAGVLLQVQQYAICVTGDHSTPVVFGDHSHEPVPLAVARVCEAVAAMGGPEQVQLRRKYMEAFGGSSSGSEGAAAGQAAPPAEQRQQQQDIGRIPLPDVKQPPALQELVLQVAQQQRRRDAAASAGTFPGATGATHQQQQQQQQQGASSLGSDEPAHQGAAAASIARGDEGAAAEGDTGSWPESWPQLLLGDGVAAFDELSAARGSLGRFTGAGVMPLLRQFAGWEQHHGESAT